MRRMCVVLAAFVAAGGSTSCTRSASGPGAPPVVVFAAASLTAPFTALAHDLRAADPALRVRTSFAGSQALVEQIRAGAPADVVATADDVTMRALVDAHQVDTPRRFARNRLAIAVRPGNPKHIAGLADLGRADVAVVLADPSVPAGRYARRALDRAAVVVSPRSLELDVRSALGKVAAGEVDAAIVYVTDIAAAEGRAGSVAIPESANVVATYSIAVVTDTHHGAAARAFVSAVLSGRGPAVLRRAGFQPG